MNLQRNKRSDEPSDLPPRLTFPGPANLDKRRDNDPPLPKIHRRLRIDVVIRAVREHNSRGR